MKSLTTPDFWGCYQKLPAETKLRARVVYKIWKSNPRHPSLHFKKIGPVWSIRIDSGVRALAVLKEDTYYWFWIGTHDDYEVLLSELR